MRIPAVILISLTLISGFAASRKTLEIYVLDVEGGKSTLFVSPNGESLLIDTGNLGEGAQRDGKRIMAAIVDAGLNQIDHLITTHWHRDHFGAMSFLADRIPIREYIDHGANIQPDEQTDAFLQLTYPKLLSRSGHRVARPGDRIEMGGVDVLVVTSGGKAIRNPIPGEGKANFYCTALKPQEPNRTENTQSVGVVITFGKFRVLDLGDLPATGEFDLMCPNNPIGTVDLFMVSHHGQAAANSELLVHAVAPRVAIMNNGMRKGGLPAVMKILYSSPGLEGLWQLHFSQLSGQEYTVPGLFIADQPDAPPPAMPIAPMNPPRPGDAVAPPPIHNGTAYWIKVSAQQDGSFAVMNGRNSFSKAYGAPRDAPAMPRGAR